ncbi:MAG: hypothetical protein A2888_01450 [Chlamydiae bacterium RIFCSPLOWO2_01_FULL_28_7]|nr:MAG: hypothetical protein A2888_01450 [Chlamydiae bacterium RIFCSPLOWO2_01_FULL_28_7]
MNLIEELKKEFYSLIELGYIAINQLDEGSALKIFKAAEVLDKTNSLIKIGYGYLHLHKLELKEAAKIFNEVLKQNPKNEMAKTFLGIVYTMTPKEVDKGEKLLKETANSSDREVQKLSGIAMDFVEKFVKRPPSPADIKKPKGK